MAQFRSVRMTLVLALVVTLLSYSFDLECYLETGHEGREIGAHADLERCSQPSLVTVAVALLPTTSTHALPAEGYCGVARQNWRPVDPPGLNYLVIPLGLRAPPLA